MDSPDHLAVLVDEHVLDTYLAVAALRPGTTLLLHAAPFADHARRVEKVVRARLGLRCTLLTVSDDSSATALDAAADTFPAGTHLHHTGGTGAMAAHLRARYARDGRADRDSSYLDEERRLLRIDDGTDVPLVELIDPATVDITVVLVLSGFTEDTRDHDIDALHRRLIADAIGALTPARGIGARRYIDQLRKDVHRLVRQRHLGEHYHEQWINGGGIFEDIVGYAVSTAAPEHDLRVGLHVARGGMRTEIDVLAVGHYRPYVISCTTGANPDTARSKLFEVILRARQVGGLTSRAAVACTVRDDATITPRDLESIARESPEPGTAPLVFGDSDVAGWLSGNAAATARLRDFLVS